MSQDTSPTLSLRRGLAWIWLWIVPPALISAAALVLWRSPTEQTIGAGIRAVYLHVPLMWTGLNGLVLASVMGLIVALTQHRRIHAWGESIGWVSLGFFAAGMGMSMVAAKINWGQFVVWSEPRTKTALALLILGVVLHLMAARIPQRRLAGTLQAIFGVVLIWALAVTPLEVHPRDPISSSTSSAIQWTFYSLFMLSTLASVWSTWVLHKLRSSTAMPR